VSKNVSQSLFPGSRLSNVTNDVGVFVCRNPKWIKRVNVFREPVANPFTLALKRSKEAIPKNQDAAVVLI